MSASARPRPADLGAVTAPRPRLSPRRAARAGRPPAFVVAGLVAAHLARWGYDYGGGDHDELLPPLLHRLDPSLFTRDAFVLQQLDGLSVRTAFRAVLGVLAEAVPLEVAAGLLYVAVLAAMAYGTVRLAYAWVPDRVGAALGAFLALVAFPYWSLGANALTYRSLLPEGVAWALAVPAVLGFVRGRRLAAGVLLGVAAWFHLLVGFQTALVLGVVTLWGAAERRSAAEAWGAVRFGLVAAAVAAPLAVPAVLSNPLVAGDGLGGRSTFEVLARLRLPHHYLFFSFPTGALVRFGLVLAGGAAALWWLRRRGVLRHGDVVVRFVAVVGVLCALAVGLTEVASVTVAAQLQLFKLTVWVTALLSLVVGAALAQALPGALRQPAEGLWDRPALGLALVVAAVGAAAVLAPEAVAGRYRPAAHAASDLGRVERWLGRHTPADALVLVPPSNSTLRVTARRSVVTDFKTMGLDLERLLRVAPAPVPARGGLGWQAALDSAYAARPADAWAPLADAFGADLALVDLDATATPPPRPPAYRQGRWAVFQVSPADPR